MSNKSICLILCFILIIVGCKQRHYQPIIPEKEPDTLAQSIPRWMIDSVVALQFLGIKLNESIASQLEGVRYEKTEKASITNRLVDEYCTTKKLSLANNKYPVDISVLTLDDTVAIIRGIIKDDIYRSLCTLYVAKYGEPSASEWYIKSGSYHWWRFVNNQEINVIWDAPENEFGRNIYRNTEILYRDTDKKGIVDSLMRVQTGYNIRQREIRDSINTIIEKRRNDSIEEEKRKKVLKDAHQI